MIFRLFAACIAFIAALAGTAAGNALRVLVDPDHRKRYTTPDTGDLIITGVLSNGLIAVLIALLTGGRRLWGAFVGGVVLTLVLGDRLDRKPFGLPHAFKATGANGKSAPAEAKPATAES